MGLKTYRDATIDHLQMLQKASDPFLRRARHVITEIHRTTIAAHALKTGDFLKVK